ncbi:DUF7064 domain-containing protein [Aromatoleum toluclasticum]|uniref:DUF7064 domain-containing protein n=1 Tax=Aromatoleum toluclasticum TaxID=92003 RepID=UPI00036998F9|nr:hypothetical protein [Aromatoleum toluclasticum]
MKLTEIQVDPRLTLEPSDDRRHALRAESVARESIPYMVVLPDEKLAAFVYTWVGGDSKAGSACCIFGPGAGSNAVFEIRDGIEVPRDADFDDWKVGDVHVRQGKPLEVVDVVYNGDRVGFEMHFEGTHPAYNYAGHRDGCPSAVADNRFEQSGLITGALRLDGRRMPFETTGHRDHSWGTRDWAAVQHWKWFQGQAGADLSVHFFEIHVAGRTYLRGYVYKEGHMAEVTSVQVDFEHDADLSHRSMTAIVADDAGRTTKVSGRTFALYPFHVSPTTVLNEAGMTVEFDGKPGVGWLEMCWPRIYVEHMAQRNG